MCNELQLRDGEGGYKSACSPDTRVMVGTWERSKEVWGRNPWISGLVSVLLFLGTSVPRILNSIAEYLICDGGVLLS